MDKLMEVKLEHLRKFQKDNPTAHVGGSIGLMLLGVDLKRDLRCSDLDITVSEFTDEDVKKGRFDNTSNGNDFDWNLVLNDEISHYYTKFDIRINPEPSFCTVMYNGEFYNVSLLSNIIFWKKKYALKGVDKHLRDLQTMGIYIDSSLLPIDDSGKVFNDMDFDDLPF